MVKINNKPSDHFDSDSTPNFLTKGIDLEPKSNSNKDEQQKPSQEKINTSGTGVKIDGSSFGFFTSDSRVCSFSADSNNKHNSASKWNSSRNTSNTPEKVGASSDMAQTSSTEQQRSNRKGSDASRDVNFDESENDLARKGGRMRPIRGHRSQREEEFDVKTAKTISSVNLRSKNVDDLIKIAGDYDVPNVNRLLKHNIISAILRSASSKGEVVYDTGVIEIVADNFGFLRYSENNYAPSSDNVYVSQNQVRRFGLKTGDIVEGYAKEPRRSEKYFSMFKIVKINNHLIGEIGNTLHFDNFTPIFPKDKLNLDLNIGIKGDVSTRLIDIIAPIGKGQRALIVAPPRSGKTVVMKNIAHAINANHPDVKLIALLIDERPEEFTDMIKCVSGEVVSSTFDEPAERHVALAEIIIAKAKRMVEQGQDVVVLLDSITRLARAYNTIAPSSGKILTGGIDSNALQRPKRFFGAARNITREGSLTIIATALVDTGSKMDEVIFEEFKGRGNSEIVLDRKLADKRLFPAIDVLRSGTRNEEEMVSGEILPKMWALRKILSGMNEQVKTGNAESIDFLLREIKKTTNNTEFFNRMNG